MRAVYLFESVDSGIETGKLLYNFSKLGNYLLSKLATSVAMQGVSVEKMARVNFHSILLWMKSRQVSMKVLCRLTIWITVCCRVTMAMQWRRIEAVLVGTQMSCYFVISSCLPQKRLDSARSMQMHHLDQTPSGSSTMCMISIRLPNLN